MAPWPIPWLYDVLISPWRRRKDDDEADETLAGLRDSTRQFVLALRVPPENPRSRAGGLVYILAAEALSEQSASDAAELVRATRPAAVVAQVAPGALAGLRSEEEDVSVSGSDRDRVPTSFFGVIRDCFLDKTQRASYESKAGIEVLRSIFGTTFHGHVVRAKTAAREANSAFLYLETPQVSDSSSSVRGFGDQGSGTRSSGFAKFTAISSEVASRVHASSLLSSFQQGLDVTRYVSQQQQQPAEIECPTFAAPFYYLFVELQETYRQLPGMNQALQHARKLLFDVEQGRPVDQEELAQAQNFRLAVEGLRIALNSAAHEPHPRNSKHRKAKSKVKFDDLSHEDKGHVLLAQAIQDQARRHGTVVAVMDANSVAGIRKHWNTVVPPEVAALAHDCFVYGESNGLENFGEGAMEKTLVGSGAVAAVGIAALPWWAPATPFTKVLILKAPAFAKLGFVQIKRSAAIMVSKTVAPILTPGKAFSAIVKTATSAGKARAAAHSVVATAERATFSAIRTAFYCLMRKKQGMSSGGRPWLLLGGSVAAGGGILWCGDKLESAIESAPTAPTVARLGRGLENLQHTAQSLSEARPRQIWEDLYRSLHK